MAKLTSAKARTMLRENQAQGKELTPRQKRFFGFIAGGGKPSRVRTKLRKRDNGRKD